MAKLETIDARMRVVVVDGDENTCIYLKKALQSSRNFSFAGSFSRATEALKEIPRLQPDFALMDIALPDLNGVESIIRLKEMMPRLEIVIITGVYEGCSIGAFSQAGASAYLLKPVTVDQLLVTLQFFCTVLGKTNGESDKNEIAPSRKPAETRSSLSPREEEVLIGLSKGLLYKEISHQLGISYAAVHKHQHNIFKKLRVNNRTEAIRARFGGNSP